MKGIANRKPPGSPKPPDAGKKGGKAAKYEDRTKKELYDKAKEVGIPGRSKMNKQELIRALRNN